jgi:hypothetical protein
MAHPGSRLSSPIVDFDPDDTFAPCHFMAIACWPWESRRQGEALVTWAAAMNGLAEFIGFNEPNMDAVVDTSLVKAAAQMGLSPESLRALPYAAEIAARARAIPAHFQNRVTAQLFNPGGGWMSMANAAYQGSVGARYEAASRAGALAGYIVLFCAQIREHHTQITASYNRALYIVEKLNRHGEIHVGSDRKRKEAWLEWRGVAHIWAAIIMALESDDLTGATGNSFSSGDGLKRTLGWAKWFRDFATTHQPSGAQHPLVHPHEAVELRMDVIAEKPPLQPLSGRAVTAAREYKAPRPSQ